MVENTEVKIEEKIYQIDWWGPFTLEKLKEEDAEYLNSISLYAKYQDAINLCALASGKQTE